MSDAHAAHADGHTHSAKPYYIVAGTLLVLTVVTILVSFVPMSSKALNVLIAVAIATFKASLVMMIFMHLKQEHRLIVFIALVPFLLVAILVLALFPDIVFGQYH